MAQHDFVINNQGFPAFRSDLNDFLNAVRTFHSGTSRPTGAVAGTIFLDTTNSAIPLLKYFDGTDDITLATINHSTNTVVFSGVSTDLVNDLTPQLGGDLDVQTNKVVTTANRNVKVYPNGTGVFEVGGSTNSGRIQLNCEQNTHGIKLASPAHSAGQNYTLTFPTTAPTANKVLQTDGSGNLSFASVSGGIEWQSVVTSATLSAVSGNGYWIDTTSNACTVTFPASATNGDTIILADYARNWGTNAVTINQNSLNFQGNTSPNPIYNTVGQSVTLVYSGATKGWIPTVDDDVTFETPQSYSIDFLVIAGGAGAGGSSVGGGSGGGGAGGFRTSTQTALEGTVITVTVGDGGSGGSGAYGIGGSGSNSSISGSGLTTITSTGGGGGGSNLVNYDGIAGGSGGGGGGNSGNTPRSVGGAGNTPSTSPSQGNSGGSVVGASGYGAGGGGAGGSAPNSPGTSPQPGGIGSANSITGSSVTYSAGGSAGNNQPGSAGTANRGNGGQGAGQAYDGGSGGKGVVILSMLTTKYTGTTTGSPTVTTSGSNTILQFNGTGSYTA